MRKNILKKKINSNKNHHMKQSSLRGSTYIYRASWWDPVEIAWLVTDYISSMWNVLNMTRVQRENGCPHSQYINILVIRLFCFLVIGNFGQRNLAIWPCWGGGGYIPPKTIHKCLVPTILLEQNLMVNDQEELTSGRQFLRAISLLYFQGNMFELLLKWKFALLNAY